jgi:hypothetical protein
MRMFLNSLQREYDTNTSSARHYLASATLRALNQSIKLEYIHTLFYTRFYQSISKSFAFNAKAEAKLIDAYSLILILGYLSWVKELNCC